MKSYNATSWHEHSHQFCPFSIKFCEPTNSPNCTKIVGNTQKIEFWVQWGGSGVFVAKNSDATSWHELLHQFDPFCTEYWKATKQSQMHPNSKKARKQEFRVQWGGSGAFIVKNSNTTLWHEILNQIDPFCTESCKATKGSQMHPNSTKRTKM